MRKRNLCHRQVERGFAGGSVVAVGGGGWRRRDPAGYRGLAVLGVAGISVLDEGRGETGGERICSSRLTEKPHRQLPIGGIDLELAKRVKFDE